MCKRICLFFFFPGGRQGLGSVDIAAHNGAVSCVNFPLVSFFGPAGTVSLF